MKKREGEMLEEYEIVGEKKKKSKNRAAEREMENR
jgi:hypothetical protein